MNIVFSQIDSEYRQAVDVASLHHIEKLDRLCKHYDPSAIQLHGSLETLTRKNTFSFSLSLTLPTGDLHATGTGTDIRGALNIAFKEIEVQFKKHQQKVRKDYLWKRKRVRSLKPGMLPAGQ